MRQVSSAKELRYHRLRCGMTMAGRRGAELGAIVDGGLRTDTKPDLLG